MERAAAASSSSWLRASSGPAQPEELLDRLRLGVHVAQDLRQAVVHLAGDPLTLAAHRHLAQLALEPGVLDGQGEERGERGERLQLIHPEGAFAEACHRQDADRRLAAMQGRGEQRAPVRLGKQVRRLQRLRVRPGKCLRRTTGRCQAAVLPGLEHHERHVTREQAPGRLRHRVEDRVKVMRRADLDPQLMQRPRGGPALFQLTGPRIERAGQQVHPATRQGDQQQRQHQGRGGDHRGVEREREERIQHPVGEQLDPAQDRDGEQDRCPPES